MHIHFFYVQSVYASDFYFPAQHFGLSGKETDIFLASPWLWFSRCSNRDRVQLFFLVQWRVKRRKRPRVPRCRSPVQTEMTPRPPPPPPSSLFGRSSAFPHICTREPDDAVWRLWRCPEVESVSWRSFITAFDAGMSAPFNLDSVGKGRSMKNNGWVSH